jgi:hypothetical protein
MACCEYGPSFPTVMKPVEASSCFCDKKGPTWGAKVFSADTKLLRLVLEVVDMTNNQELNLNLPKMTFKRFLSWKSKQRLQ